MPAQPPKDKVDTLETLARCLADTELIFYAWVLSLVIFGWTGFTYKTYDTLTPLLIAGLLVSYIWIFLLVRLDQLASAVGKSPSTWVYSSLLLPVLGNCVSFYFLHQCAESKIRELQSA
jgi:hypothetical protein